LAHYTPNFHKKNPSHFAGSDHSSYTSPMLFNLRDVSHTDLDAVLELNESVVPAVNSITIEQMRWFADQAAYFRIAEDNDRLAAFLIGLRPGSDYNSPNYLWFCRHYDDFGYVDRVAVADHARRSGLASKLYDDFRANLPDSISVMTCEVNLKPPNESSMRFHEGMGFHQVGSLAIDDGKNEVALMELKL